MKKALIIIMAVLFFGACAPEAQHYPPEDAFIPMISRDGTLTFAFVPKGFFDPGQSENREWLTLEEFKGGSGGFFVEEPVKEKAKGPDL